MSCLYSECQFGEFIVSQASALKQNIPKRGLMYVILSILTTQNALAYSYLATITEL